MTVSTLNNYSFAWNDYVFGGGSSVHQIYDVQGLESLPSIRNQDDNRGYADGMFSGNDFYGGRTVTMTVVTFGGGGFSAPYNFNLLQRALQPQVSGTTPLQFQLSPSDSLQRVNARVRGNMTLVDPDYTYGYIKSSFTFFCPDPRRYDDALQSATLLVTDPLGRTYNRVYPLLYGGGSAASYAAVLNNGWATTYPTISITGPFTGLTIGNYAQGNYISISGTYTATDVITIDLDSKVISLNGVSARNLMVGGSKWFSAPPGTSQFYMTASGTSSGITQGTITWRSAYT